MSSAQIDGCKHKIKEILKKYIFEYPLFEIELVELIHDEFPKDVIRIACNQLNDEGYIDGIIGLDENNQEYVYAIGGLK